MKNKLLNIIDFEKVNVLLEGYNKTTGFVTAILDLEGNVLSKSGWRQMCTDFHRINPETSKRCTISDTELAGKMVEGEKYHFYKCLNGLVDVAIPIVINGEHVANLFSGQFFFEEPDLQFFKKQAKKYGFDEEKYIKALENVPVISKEKVKITMDFLLNMTQLITEMTFQKLEQLELNEALKKSDTLFQDLVETTQDLIWQCDAEGRYTYLNPAWEEVFGYTVDEMLGKKFVDFQTKEWAERDLKEFERLLKKNTIKGLETVHIGKEGKEINLIFNAKFVHNEKGDVIGTRGSAFNASDIIKAERALHESNERLKLILANTPIAIWDWDLKTDRWFATPKYYTMLGYEPEDGYPDRATWLNRVHPDDREEVAKKIANILDHTSDSYSYDARMLHADGTYRWQTVLGHVIESDENHNAKRILGVRIDVTERKHAEEDLKESQFFFKQLFIQSSTSTQLLDSEGWCVRINPKLTELFGVNPDDIEGKKYNILQDGEIIRTGVINHLKRVFENKETVRWEVNFDIQHASETTGVKVSKPEKRWFQNLAYPILNAEGKLIYVIVQHEDITDRKQAEEEIKKLNKELEKRVDSRTKELSNSQAALLNIVEDLNEKTELLAKSAKLLETKNKELETFTYSVSHDLKAPLRGIDGYSRLLQDLYSGDLNDEAKQFIKTIRESTIQMNQLIEDLLAYSRLERTSLRFSNLKIKNVIESILALLKNEINANKIKITTEVNDSEIVADFDGLSIALRNIIENAIKFARKIEKPEIKIVLKENVFSWLISVEDNGIGFDMKYHNRIFEIFQRLNLPEQYKGTGIGLAMVSKSMERMGGKVWAESNPGSGAIFYIELPKV